MKLCNRCNIKKSLDDFNWRSKSKNRKQSLCKTCQGEINQKHYQNNSQDYKQRARDATARLKTKFVEWLLTKCCVDCGEKDPVVLDCDHVSGTKKYNLSVMIKNSKPWNEILEELDKCEVRCANCHRRKTAKQFGWIYRLQPGARGATDPPKV